MKSLLALMLAPALISPMPVAAESSWTYINDASDNTLYFGRNIRNFEGITFIEIKTEGNPDGSNGDDNSWNQALDCKNETIRGKSGIFEPIQKDRVGYQWFKFACNK